MMLRGVQNQPWSEWIRKNEEVRKWDDSFFHYIINGSSPPHQSRVFSIPLVYRRNALNARFWKRLFMSFPFRSDSDPPLFPFPPAPFPRNEKEDGTLELYYLSAYCLPKILLLQLVGHRVIQISCVFCGFPMLKLPYQFGRSGMDRLNILLGSLVLTLLCGIHSRSALGITSSRGWNSSQNPTTSPTSLPPTVSRTSIETEWFHVPSSIGYSSPFVSLFPISVSISLQDWMANFPPDPRFDCFPRMLSRVCKPCIWEEVKEGLSLFAPCFGLAAI